MSHDSVPLIVNKEDHHITWSCGCETWTEGAVFYIKPCSKECEVYTTAMRMSQEQNKKIMQIGQWAG